MWEYKLRTIQFKMYSELIDELNKDGKENWEIFKYEEEKPNKYGCDNKVTILYKRMKPT
jgi:hypothetical protein